MSILNAIAKNLPAIACAMSDCGCTVSHAKRKLKLEHFDKFAILAKSRYSDFVHMQLAETLHRICCHSISTDFLDLRVEPTEDKLVPSLCLHMAETGSELVRNSASKCLGFLVQNEVPLMMINRNLLIQFGTNIGIDSDNCDLVVKAANIYGKFSQ